METLKNLKKTPLYEEHNKLPAHFAEFSGWLMPFWYEGIYKEALAVRTKAGLFDISHMGKIGVWGPDAQEFMEKLCAGNIKKLNEGKTLYTVLCNENGGIIDDLIIYRSEHLFLGPVYLLIANAVNTDKVFSHLKLLQEKGFEVALNDNTLTLAMLALQGPEAKNILKNIPDFPSHLMPEKRNEFRAEEYEETPLIVSRTGYTGEDGFEIIAPNYFAQTLWQKLLRTGKEFGLEPCGLSARNTLRIEAGLPLYGHEIDENINPLEAGLEKFIELEKSDDFIGKSALKSLKEADPKRKLVGFEVQSPRMSRQGYLILKDGKVIGSVTSGVFSPTLKKNIGMGYVIAEFSEIGTDIEIEIIGKKYPAKIVRLPFYKREGK